MDLPAFLPPPIKKSLQARGDIPSALTFLQQDANNLATILACTAEDTRWFQAHQNLLRAIFTRLSSDLLAQHINFETASTIAQPIRLYFSLFEPLLPATLPLDVSGSSYLVSPLLWWGCSKPLYQMKPPIKLPLSQEEFSALKGYIERGSADRINHLSFQKLWHLLSAITPFETGTFQEICETKMGLYLTRENIAKVLLSCSDNEWNLLVHEVARATKAFALGLEILPQKRGAWTLQFLHFQPSANRFFEEVSEGVRALAFREDLMQFPQFTDIVKQCPRLESLDLNSTTTFSERLFTAPEGLQQLDLSLCEWLTDRRLIEVLSHFSRLHTLSLAGNRQLSYIGLGALASLPHLVDLNLSYIPLSDQELLLILRGNPKLTTLSLEGNVSLTDRSLESLGQTPHLRSLNLKRTRLSQEACSRFLGEIEEVILPAGS